MSHDPDPESACSTCWAVAVGGNSVQLSRISRERRAEWLMAGNGREIMFSFSEDGLVTSVQAGFAFGRNHADREF
jgi:hypothetical protein